MRELAWLHTRKARPFQARIPEVRGEPEHVAVYALSYIQQIGKAIKPESTWRPRRYSHHLRNSNTGVVRSRHLRFEAVWFWETPDQFCHRYECIWQLQLAPDITCHLFVANLERTVLGSDSWRS